MQNIKFAVAIPTISSYRTLPAAIESVIQQDVSTDLLLIQNGSPPAPICDEYEKKGVSVYRPGENLGCSASWNYAMNWAWERGHDKIFLMNDDFYMLDGDILQGIQNAILDNPQAHYHLDGFSAVCITKDMWNLVGNFDEGFYPAYFEDNDYYNRSMIHNIKWDLLPANIRHDHSSSVRSSAFLTMMNSRSFLLNKKRFIAKWGGPPHAETFKEPWDGKEPAMGNVKDLLREMGWTKFYE